MLEAWQGGEVSHWWKGKRLLLLLDPLKWAAEWRRKQGPGLEAVGAWKLRPQGHSRDSTKDVTSECHLHRMGP